ncbi:SMP-30/gluconolactonase/LRE family protein [Nocardioides humilatus]|uniref:SMP-30/gluconolactonase/LRE family protein n=1 Tax=Nocardioides humilatus TaxID=2607660 RepID=A0A5B1LNW2_9ACTN|nr:SMP-30/gluconolactonase/LRE family protein [Nocardioides humilatus]KAA1421798.1 SMP-30/gluconolactonase/LRE family protein [Nocardioides humilatus]
MSVESLGAPEVVVPASAEVGEGPVLDSRTGNLVWVDITQGWLFQTELVTGATESEHFDTMVGAALPRTDEPGFLLAVSDGFGLWTPDGGLTMVDPCLAEPHLRFNDAKCDSRGRAWGGSLFMDFTPGGGELRRYDGTGPSTVHARGLTQPNGIGWSPDDQTMYLIDTQKYVLLRADFDADSGEVGEFSALCAVDGAYPDGLAVDLDGNIWIAMWDGWEVRRYSPAGEQTGVITMPVANASSCAISADGTLYITSANAGLSEEALAAQPLAGSVFAINIGVAGVPVSGFRG